MNKGPKKSIQELSEVRKGLKQKEEDILFNTPEGKEQDAKLEEVAKEKDQNNVELKAALEEQKKSLSKDPKANEKALKVNAQQLSVVDKEIAERKKEVDEKDKLPPHLQEKLDKFKDAGHKLMGNDHQAKQQKYADRADAANTKSFGDLYKEDMKSSWGRIKDTFQNAEVAKDENEAFAQLLMLLFEMIAFLLSPLSNVANAAGDKAKNALKEQFWNALSDIQGNKFNDPSNQQKVLKGLEGQRDDIENKIFNLKEQQAGQEPGSVEHKRSENAIKYQEAKLEFVNDSIDRTEKHLKNIQNKDLNKREGALLDEEKKLGEKDAKLKQELADLEAKDDPKNKDDIDDLKERINRNDEKIQRNHNELDRINRDRAELSKPDSKPLKPHNPERTEKELDGLKNESDRLQRNIDSRKQQIENLGDKDPDKVQKLQARNEVFEARKKEIEGKIDDKTNELESSLVEKQQRLVEDRKVLEIQAHDDAHNDLESTLRVQDALKKNTVAQNETSEKLSSLRENRASNDQNVSLGDAPNPEPKTKEEKLQSIDDQIENKKEELQELSEQRGKINGEMQELERNRPSLPNDNPTQDQRELFAQQQQRYENEKQRLIGEREQVDDQISKAESDIDKLSREKQEVGFDSPKEEQLEARSRSLDSNQEETAIEGDNQEDAIDAPEEIAEENQRVARERGSSPSSTEDDEPILEASSETPDAEVEAEDEDVLTASAPEDKPEEEDKEENTEEAEDKPELPKHYQEQLDKFKDAGHKLMGNDHQAKQQKYADRADAANTKSFGDLYKEDMKSSWGRIKDTFQNAEVAKDENEAFAQLLMLMFEMIAFALSPLTNVGNAAGDKAKNAIKEQFWNALSDMQGNKFNDPSNQQKVLKGLEGQRDDIENKIFDLKEKQAGQEPGSVEHNRSADAIRYQEAKLDVVNDSIAKTEKHLKNIQNKDLNKREGALLDEEKKLGEKDAMLKQELADLEAKDDPKNKDNIDDLKERINRNDEKIQRNHNELDRINRDRAELSKPDSKPLKPHNPERTEKELDGLKNESDRLQRNIDSRKQQIENLGDKDPDKVQKLQARNEVFEARKKEIEGKIDDKSKELEKSLEEQQKRLAEDRKVLEIQAHDDAHNDLESTLRIQDDLKKNSEAQKETEQKLTKLKESRPDQAQDDSVKLGDAPPNPIEKTEKELDALNKEKQKVDQDIEKNKGPLASMEAGPEKDKLQKEQDALKEQSKELREKIGNKENEYAQQLEAENKRLQEQRQDAESRPQSGSNNDLVAISDAQNANQDKLNALRTSQNERHRQELQEHYEREEQQRQEENDRVQREQEQAQEDNERELELEQEQEQNNAPDADSPTPQGPSDPSDEELEQSIGSDVSEAADKKRATRAGAPAQESDPSLTSDEEGGPKFAAGVGAGAGGAAALASEDAEAEDKDASADAEKAQTLEEGENDNEEELDEEQDEEAVLQQQSEVEAPKPKEPEQEPEQELSAKSPASLGDDDKGADASAEAEEPEQEAEERLANFKEMPMSADEGDEEEPEAEASEDAKSKSDDEPNPMAAMDEGGPELTQGMPGGDDESPDPMESLQSAAPSDGDSPASAGSDQEMPMDMDGMENIDVEGLNMDSPGGGDEQMEMGTPSLGGSGGGGGMPGLGDDDEEKPKEEAKDDKGSKKGKEEESESAEEEDPMTEVSSKMLEVVQKAFESITNPSSAMGDEAKGGMDMEGGGGMEMGGGGDKEMGGGDPSEMMQGPGGGGGMDMGGMGGGGDGKDKKDGKGKDDPMSKVGEGLPKEGKALVGGICKVAGALAAMAEGLEMGGGNDAKKGEEAGKQMLKVLQDLAKVFKGGLQGGMGGGAKPGGEGKGKGKGKEGPGGGGGGGLGADGGGDMAEGMGGAEMAGDMDGGMNPMSMAKDAKTLQDPDASKGEKAEVAGKWAARAMGVPPPADAMVGKVVKAAVDKMEEMDPGKKLQALGDTLNEMGEACHEATKSKEPDPAAEAMDKAEQDAAPVTNMKDNAPMQPLKQQGGGMGMEAPSAGADSGPSGPKMGA